MKRKLWLATIFCLMMGSTSVFGQERPKEGDLFGGDQTAVTPAASLPGNEDTASPAASKGTNIWENTQIGGTLSSEVDYTLQKGVPLDQNTTSNPNILFLYLDSKLENDSRVFARIRSFYDPTGESTGTPGTGGYTNPYGEGNGGSDYLSVQLQELRISTNIDHAVFLTLGRQKVKYGVANFFNPTDFLNSQPYDFFLPSDERTGVDMVQAEVPIGTTNFYAIGLPGNPSNENPSGGYFREEVGYNGVNNFLESGEISFSAYLPKGELGRGGFNLSQGVGDLDVYFEGAAGQDVTGDWKGSFSTGVQWQTRLLTDRQTEELTLDGEYSQFPLSGPNTGFTPTNLTQLGVLSINWAGPGSLADLTFIETNIYDFNGQSGFSRLDTVCQFTERISGRVYVSAPWGSQGGAFYFPGLQGQAGARMDVSF
jgi:hypothetical protein